MAADPCSEQWCWVRVDDTRVKSLQFLYYPTFHLLFHNHGTWNLALLSNTPTLVLFLGETPPITNLRSWKVCFVIRGISHVSFPYWAVDINLTWSWNLDLVKFHVFIFFRNRLLQPARIGMTWLVHRVVRMKVRKFTWHFLVFWEVGSSGTPSCFMASCSPHLGVRKLLEDMDRRLGPSVTWTCCKVVKGMKGWFGWIWVWGKSEVHRFTRSSLLAWCLTKFASQETEVRIEDLTLCSVVSRCFLPFGPEVITYSAAMNSLSKTGDWAMATGLLRQLDAELSMNGKDTMTVGETPWYWRRIQGTSYPLGTGGFHNVFFHFGY